LTPSFSQKHADEYNYGKEDDSNWKYTWKRRYGLNQVESVSIIENENYILKGIFSTGTTFEFNIPNVWICRCKMNDGTNEDFAVSKQMEDFQG
jgi:hypothetical protein